MSVNDGRLRCIRCSGLRVAQKGDVEKTVNGWGEEVKLYRYQCQQCRKQWEVRVHER